MHVMSLKVIGFLLYLTDGDKVNINKLKQLSLPQIDVIFKVCQLLLPLVGWFAQLAAAHLSLSYKLEWIVVCLSVSVCVCVC